jgi:hypothetical protein
LSKESKEIRTIEGLVIADPLKNAPVGTTLDISFDLFTAKPPPGLDSIANWDYFQGAVVAIHFGEPHSQRVLGSGVLIAPGVVMTARHVIEPEQNPLPLANLK